MAAGHNDPKLLYAINGVSAFHIANGKEEPLNPAGPQTLSLLMVPTSSPFADLSVGSGSASPEEDFYLHLNLPPELDLPLPATTQIYHQPPTSYLIPRWDLGRESGAFTRIEFPAVGSRKGVQEDVDTFETILAQCTAFLERAPPPRTSKREHKSEKSGYGYQTKRTSGASSFKAIHVSEPLPPYNPGNYKPGEGYAKGSQSAVPKGQIVLIDEEDGSVIGELDEDFQVVEDGALLPGSKEPVEITLPVDGGHNIAVAPASQENMEMMMHPAYRKSFLVSNAALASRLIITGSELAAKALQTGATTFARNTKPQEPVTFKPATHDRIRRINTISNSAYGLSKKAVGQINNVAQNLGAHLAKRGGKSGASSVRGLGPDGKPLESFKPGVLNKSMMAFSTVFDGIEQAGRNLLDSTTSATTSVVTHRWGPEAGEISKSIGGGFKNVGLVYIDVTGVSRRAILKSVAKGMVIGRVPGGGAVIVGGGDGGEVTVQEQGEMRAQNGADVASYTSGSGEKKPSNGNH